jgi:hypothetical protein
MYWFKRKRYGWGWTPSTWQGWLVLAGFLVVVWVNFMRFDIQPGTHGTLPVEFILETIFLVAALLYICWKKGEPPRWQWGNRRD